MFSGIVEEQALVVEIQKSEPTRIRIKSKLNHAYSKPGDSICVNGACLTIVKIENDILDFELSPETLQRTNFGRLDKDSIVNLERSLIVGDRIHGHFVFGHVDGLIELKSAEQKSNCKDMRFSIPQALKKFVVEKGSLAINGVSLTVSSVASDTFTVSVVPHTLLNTTLGSMQPGTTAHFEADMLARYIMEKAV